ncbi:MAG: hypothetical protein K9I94_15350 [Bacteroidales bacterium]|nr:hypothetical protein [Bacteroidales bacterium]
MSKPIKVLNDETIRDILNSADKRIIFEKTNVIPDEKDLYDRLKAYVDYSGISRKSVLGIDIYQYSSYGEFEQTLIPFLYNMLFQKTIDLCLTNHRFIFQKYARKTIEQNFISTGDGGFLIFDNPLHSLLFAANFTIVLRIYNAFHFYPKLRKIIGGISIRFAITFDKVYSFKENYYGRAIINNARILSKDNLNRCLIDQHVHSWFTTNMEGLENLQIVTMNEISNIYEFNTTYDPKYLETHKDEIFGTDSSRKNGIINSDILKIGKIKSKETDLTIYNLHLQVTLKLVNDDDPNQQKVITVSLGNLNTTGI